MHLNLIKNPHFVLKALLMNKFSLLAPLIACIALVSCNMNQLTNDDNAFQLLMGAPSKEALKAVGIPMKQSGSLSNGTMRWYKNYDIYETVETRIDPSDLESDTVITEVKVKKHYDLNITTSKDKVVTISYAGNLPIVYDKWFYDNIVRMTLNHACAENDLQLLQSLLQEHASLCSAPIMAQAAAQAARYKSKEALDYLIQTQGVDVNAPLQTWMSTEIRGGTMLTLTNTTIAEIIKAAQ